MSFTNETEKQKYYIDKCRELIKHKENEYGRKLTACVVTFGCQMNFKDSEKLMGILKAGRVAPTAKNLQEQKIYVVQSKEYLDKIDACTPCRYHAPTVLVVAYDKNNVFDYPGNERNSGIEDATIVATHLMLAAYNAGIDSCWINFFNPQEMKKALDLPENEEVVMMLDLGYGNQKEPLPNHHLKKELAETVKYL